MYLLYFFDLLERDEKIATIIDPTINNTLYFCHLSDAKNSFREKYSAETMNLSEQEWSYLFFDFLKDFKQKKILPKQSEPIFVYNALFNCNIFNRIIKFLLSLAIWTAAIWGGIMSILFILKNIIISLLFFVNIPSINYSLLDLNRFALPVLLISLVWGVWMEFICRNDDI